MIIEKLKEELNDPTTQHDLYVTIFDPIIKYITTRVLPYILVFLLVQIILIVMMGTIMYQNTIRIMTLGG